MWFLLALLAAVLAATSDALRKGLVRNVDPTVVAALSAAAAAAGLLPVVAAEGVRLDVSPYLTAVVVSGGINAVAAVLIARAVQLSDLSLVTPLLGVTPVFTLAVAAVVLGELPTPAGLAGVLVIVTGTWVLAVGEGGAGLAAPLRALWAEPGARLMILVAFLYGTSSTFDKVGVLASTPLGWALSLMGVVALLTGARVVASERRRRQVSALDAGTWALLVAMGLALACMLAAQMTALTTGLAGYVIAVKRTSILLAVVAGGVFFEEGRMAVRLAGSAVILAGLTLLALG